MNLRKIISGGQTGADRTALEVAEELGFETGGTVPKGCRTDEGPAPDLITRFGCVEHFSTSYVPRTEKNVRDADATVLFGDMSSPGCKLTLRYCQQHLKMFKINPSGGELRDWLDEHNIEVLNVAGNRARTNPRIVAQVRGVLIDALLGAAQ